MALTADFYVPGHSWLHRLDPRVKLAFAGCAVVLLIVLRGLGVMLVASGLLLLLHASAGVPLRRLAELIAALLPVSALMFLLRVAFYPEGPAILAIGPLQITTGALAQGAALGLRLIAMGLAIFSVLYSTRGEALVRGLASLGIPYSLALTLGLALRFIPTLRLGHESIARAQRARGLDLERLKGWNRARAQMPIFVALIVSSFRASEQLARALEARAFNAPGVRRTAWIELRFSPVDGLLLGLVLLGTAAVVYLHWRYGFGAGAV
jgi:energy-coupling factor transport system permease protein